MAYTPSAAVKKREEDYYAHLKNKPGEFSSENTAKANQALDNYINRGDFKYNPATDTSYRAAKKQYVRGGQQAMKDTLGTATELTGGYDNSYAQAAAQQTYNGYMAELANLMPQYEQQAYGRWQDQGNQMLNYYDIYKNAEAQDYAMHRDKVGDYNAEADRLYGQYMDAYNADYGAYRDDVADQQYADQWALTQEQWAHEKSMEQAAAKAAQTNADADYYSAWADYNESLEENEPIFYEYAGNITDDFGERTGTRFYYDGKEMKYDLGVNPYTSTINRDVKNGAKTANNGYQPLQIGVYDNGKLVKWMDLKETGYEDDRNGKWQNVYTSGDGRYWVWNGKLNEYEQVENPEPDRSDLTSKVKKDRGYTM